MLSSIATEIVAQCSAVGVPCSDACIILSPLLGLDTLPSQRSHARHPMASLPRRGEGCAGEGARSIRADDVLALLAEAGDAERHGVARLQVAQIGRAEGRERV